MFATHLYLCLYCICINLSLFAFIFALYCLVAVFPCGFYIVFAVAAISTCWIVRALSYTLNCIVFIFIFIHICALLYLYFFVDFILYLWLPTLAPVQLLGRHHAGSGWSPPLHRLLLKTTNFLLKYLPQTSNNAVLCCATHRQIQPKHKYKYTPNTNTKTSSHPLLAAETTNFLLRYLPDPPFELCCSVQCNGMVARSLTGERQR